jgi:hypothetical protein
MKSCGLPLCEATAARVAASPFWSRAALNTPVSLGVSRQVSRLKQEAGSSGYLFPDLDLTLGLSTGAGVLATTASLAESLAKRCARNRAVLRRVTSSWSTYSFQAAAPCRACSSLRKCLLALRTAGLSCSAILGSFCPPSLCPHILFSSEKASRSDVQKRGC